MEYLVTYGWALLALFAVVALLISSGAFSSSNFTVAECTFQPDLPCTSYILYKNPATGETTLQFSISNGLGFPIKITNMSYVATDLGLKGRNEYPIIAGLPSPQFSSGDKMNFTYAFTGTAIQPGVHDFRTIYVSLAYSNCRFTPCVGNYTTSGRISVPVEQGS